MERKIEPLVLRLITPPLSEGVSANSPGVFLRSSANSPQNLTPPEFFQKKLTPSEKNARAFGTREKIGPFLAVLQGKINKSGSKNFSRAEGARKKFRWKKANSPGVFQISEANSPQKLTPPRFFMR